METLRGVYPLALFVEKVLQVLIIIALVRRTRQ
jgi:hypothetical protein